MVEGLRMIWKGRGFGNALIVAHLTKILNDNGAPAVFNNSSIAHLVDVPLDDGTHPSFKRYAPKFPSTHFYRNCEIPILQIYLNHIGDLLGDKVHFYRNMHNHIPVKYYDIDIEPVDIVLNTKTGPWAPYRDWPYFDQLKEMLVSNNLTYIDLNEKGIINIECLNYVNKARLYVGLETGTSHYVSKFANDKALIIQGGFTPFWYWAYPYDYDCVYPIVKCNLKHCFIDRKDIANGIVCEDPCINAITPERVMDEILRRI